MRLSQKRHFFEFMKCLLHCQTTRLVRYSKYKIMSALFQLCIQVFIIRQWVSRFQCVIIICFGFCISGTTASTGFIHPKQQFVHDVDSHSDSRRLSGVRVANGWSGDVDATPDWTYDAENIPEPQNGVDCGDQHPLSDTRGESQCSIMCFILMGKCMYVSVLNKHLF